MIIIIIMYLVIMLLVYYKMLKYKMGLIPGSMKNIKLLVQIKACEFICFSLLLNELKNLNTIITVLGLY